MNKFKVITLCGSTRFKEEFNKLNEELTLMGNVVISVGVFGHHNGIILTKEIKEKLDNIHRQKIDMSDEIFVINKYGYIGQSTKSEIEYAKARGKKVRYLEEVGQ